MKLKQILLFDTNIIIEAVRVKCWSALTTHFHIETVTKCCEEARTGNRRRSGYVEVNDTHLQPRLTVHAVSEVELAHFDMHELVESFRLDEGERHLWAHALQRTDEWFACCCDRAAVNVAVRLGWKDRLVALEELVNQAGARTAIKHLKPQFYKARLSEWVTASVLQQGLP